LGGGDHIERCAHIATIPRLPAAQVVDQPQSRVRKRALLSSARFHCWLSTMVEALKAIIIV